MILFSGTAGRSGVFISKNYSQQLFRSTNKPQDSKQPPFTTLQETTAVQGEAIYDSSPLSLSLVPVPTIEDFSSSPSLPRTTLAVTTTAASTVKVQGDTTMSGADPRDGRDPFEDMGGSVTAEPTIPQLPPTPRRFCEATRRRAIDWPQTHTGSTADRPCPKGTRGTITVNNSTQTFATL